MDTKRKSPRRCGKRLYIDGISETTSKGVIFAINERFPLTRRRVEALKREKIRYLQRLEQANIEVTITNPRTTRKGKIFPVLGSNHIKGVVIDNDPFYFGGVNFNLEDVEALDFMVKFTGKIAKKLSDQFDRIHESPPKEDFQMQLSEDTWLLYDAGIPNQSLILDIAIDLIKDAPIVKNTSSL